MIKVYFDTNILENRSDSNIVIADKILSSKFYDCLSYISSNSKLKQSVKLLIAQVSIDEIKQHIKEAYLKVNEIIDQFKNDVTGIFRKFDKKNKVKLPETENKTLIRLNKEVRTLLNSYEFIQVEKHNNKINEIYKQAVTKKKPFYSKKAPKVDAGFKDALLLKTINDNLKDEDVILYTKDGDFGDVDIFVTKSFDELKRVIELKAGGPTLEEQINNFLNQEYIYKRIIEEVCPGDSPKITLLRYYNSEDNSLDEINMVDIEIKISENQILKASYNIDIKTNEIALVEL